MFKQLSLCNKLNSQVIVIDKGQIAEMGTHSELLAKHGVYKKLVLRQLTAGYPVDQGTDRNGLTSPQLGHNINGNSFYVNEGLTPDEMDNSDDENLIDFK